MTKKQKIIVISVILSIFVIVMIIIAVFQYKQNIKILEEPTTQGQFVEQEVKDLTVEETTEVSTENVELRIGDKTVTHLERLTHEQSADKSALFAKVASRAGKDSDVHGKIVTEEILDSSYKYRVFVDVTFEDGEKITYVCGYDATNMHKFLRCVSLEEWEAEQNGANAG